MRSKKAMITIATLIVAIGISALWFSPVADSVSPVRSGNISYAKIEPEISRIIQNHGMHVIEKHSFSLIADGMNITFMISSLMENKTYNTGIAVTVIMNNHVIGSIMGLTLKDGNGYCYTLIPLYSTILKSTMSFHLNNTNFSSTSNPQVQNTVSSDAQYFPTGTFSTGFAGWAYSWSQYQLEGLLTLLTGSGAVLSIPTVVSAIVSAGISAAVAEIIGPILLTSAPVLVYFVWMGGYNGIYVGYTTSFWGGLETGHVYGMPWVWYNPAPNGY
jgi:hypothetical protein